MVSEAPASAGYRHSPSEEGEKRTGRWNQERSPLSEPFTVVRDLWAGSSEFKHGMTPEAFNVQPSFKHDLGGENGL